MKRVLLLVVVSLVCGSGLAGAQSVSVKASIDAACVPRDTIFTVPAGQTAIDLVASGLSSGTHCTTGGRVANPAWGISSPSKCRSGDVFYYNQNDNGRVSETPTPLRTLRLSPGRYCLHVDGGIQASVSLTFSLVPPAPAPAAGPGGAAAAGAAGAAPAGSASGGGAGKPAACDIAGTWSFTYETTSMVLTLRQADSRLDGTLRMKDSSINLEATGPAKGTVSARDVKITATNPDGEAMTLSGSVSADCQVLTLSMTMDGETHTMAFRRR